MVLNETNANIHAHIRTVKLVHTHKRIRYMHKHTVKGVHIHGNTYAHASACIISQISASWHTPRVLIFLACSRGMYALSILYIESTAPRIFITL